MRIMTNPNRGRGSSQPNGHSAWNNISDSTKVQQSGNTKVTTAVSSNDVTTTTTTVSSAQVLTVTGSPETRPQQNASPHRGRGRGFQQQHGSTGTRGGFNTNGANGIRGRGGFVSGGDRGRGFSPRGYRGRGRGSTISTT